MQAGNIGNNNASFAITPDAQTPANSLVFVAMTHCRVVDTRPDQGFTGTFGPPNLVGGMSRTFPIQSSTRCSIPSIAQAYSFNVTVVPFVFALHRDGGGGVRLYWIVDDKRKRTSELRRLENIRSQPTVEVVVDRYNDDDWTALWWVRARGRGRLVSSIPERDVALDALASKYAQYASVTSAAHVVAIDVDSVTGWSADDPADR